jgi:hypothetical protein
VNRFLVIRRERAPLFFPSCTRQHYFPIFQTRAHAVMAVHFVSRVFFLHSLRFLIDNSSSLSAASECFSRIFFPLCGFSPPVDWKIDFFTCGARFSSFGSPQINQPRRGGATQTKIISIKTTSTAKCTENLRGIIWARLRAQRLGKYILTRMRNRIMR